MKKGPKNRIEDLSAPVSSLRRLAKIFLDAFEIIILVNDNRYCLWNDVLILIIRKSLYMLLNVEKWILNFFRDPQNFFNCGGPAKIHKNDKKIPIMGGVVVGRVWLTIFIIHIFIFKYPEFVKRNIRARLNLFKKNRGLAIRVPNEFPNSEYFNFIHRYKSFNTLEIEATDGIIPFPGIYIFTLTSLRIVHFWALLSTNWSTSRN